MPGQSNRTVLYLSYDGLTDPLGQSQILPYLLELEKQGFSFFVISFEKKEALAKDGDTVRALISEKKIYWHQQPYHRHPPVLSTMYDLWCMQRAASSLHRQQGFDAVWCRSYLPALAGMRLKKRRGLPFVFDMRGFWPDERVEGGSWHLSNPVYRAVYKYFKKKEKELLYFADHVVVLTQKAKKIIEEGGLGVTVSAGISVVPCCVDTEHFSPDNIATTDKQRKRRELAIEDGAQVLVYAGSLGTWYLLIEMLEYFRNLLEQDRSWVFLFITRDNPEMIWSKLEQVGLPKKAVRIVAAARAEVPLYLSLGSLAICFIMPTFSKQASSPTKLAEYMAMGLPVVCNEGVGDVGQIVMGDRASTLRLKFNEAAENRYFTRASAISHFSIKNRIKGYNDMLHQICIGNDLTKE